MSVKIKIMWHCHLPDKILWPHNAGMGFVIRSQMKDLKSLQDLGPKESVL